VEREVRIRFRRNSWLLVSQSFSELNDKWEFGNLWLTISEHLMSRGVCRDKCKCSFGSQLTLIDDYIVRVAKDISDFEICWAAIRSGAPSIISFPNAIKATVRASTFSVLVAEEPHINT